MSSFKLLKRDCKHAKGFAVKTGRCDDCGTKAPPSLCINFIFEQLRSNTTGAEPPNNLSLALRLRAIEEYLEQQHEIEEAAASPIVVLS